MAFFVKYAKTIRTHWKKSTLGACLLVYGVKYIRDRQAEEVVRRAYCQEAEKYGNALLDPTSKPRRVTVFLNPASQGGRGTKLFTKNAAPILYLAGMEVNVVKTEYEGQVKEFVKLLETQDTDAIVVAGGDGTLLEAVTGYMRKEDRTFRSTIPVGVIPLGSTNKFAQLLFGTDLNEVRLIAESAMAIIKGETKLFDVMKIEGNEGKATYALTGLESGLYKEAEQRKTKNWYFGPLKHYWTYMRTTLRQDWPCSLQGKLSYVEATKDNTKLVAPKISAPPKPKSSSWLSLLYNQSAPPPVFGEPVMDNSTDMEQERDLSAIEFTILSSNYSSEKNVLALDLGIGPEEPSKTEFISEGWRRVKERKENMLIGSDSNEHLQVKSLHFEPAEEAREGQWFNIDGERFEAMPVTISLLPNRLQIYCTPRTEAVS